MKDIHDQTYYELLEIDRSATQEEILKAYNRARATYGHNSPALYSLFNKEEAQELLRLIDEAYAVLSNQFKRRQYDTQSDKPLEAPQKQSDDRRTTPTQQAPVPSTLSESDFAIPSAGSLPEFSGGNEFTETSRAAPPQSFSAPSATSSPPASTSRVESPHGTGNSPFGSYVIDPLFEDEIKRTDEFPGTFLQRVRLYKNISLDQICETTKISRPYLIAIEAGNFTSLPAPVFVRGFLVQISKILGLDPHKVASSFIKLLKEAQGK